ncbi:MAG: hypothetical protein ACFBSG_15810 [Leptolyngbyaceae cyanobacterium]
MRQHVASVTIFFLNDRWVTHLRLHPDVDVERGYNCRAVLNENGRPYHPTLSLVLALQDLDAGHEPTQVMNRFHLAIVSHGAPNPAEVGCFQKQFVAGLGYCPQVLA